MMIVKLSVKFFLLVHAWIMKMGDNVTCGLKFITSIDHDIPIKKIYDFYPPLVLKLINSIIFLI